MRYPLRNVTVFTTSFLYALHVISLLNIRMRVNEAEEGIGLDLDTVRVWIRSCLRLKSGCN